MTGAEFITYIKAKLNRLDTSAYEDIRPEEVLLFANEALKTLVLEFDKGRYSALIDEKVIGGYLNTLIVTEPEADITNNEFTYPSTVLKYRDIDAYVVAGDEEAWRPADDKSRTNKADKEDNPMTKSYPDRPDYRIEDGKVKFDVDDTFNVTKYASTYLKFPDIILSESTLSYPFMTELENKTVTLLLENLDSRRLETQPTVSKM